MFYCYGLKANRCFSFRSVDQFIIVCYFSMCCIVTHFIRTRAMNVFLIIIVIFICLTISFGVSGIFFSENLLF